MARAILHVGLGLLLAATGCGLAAAQTGNRADVPLNVMFTHLKSGTNCASGPAWCGDGNLFYSDTQERYLIAEILITEDPDAPPEGEFRFFLGGTNVRRVVFDFGKPVTGGGQDQWCFEACPDSPKAFTPNFATDPIKTVTLWDMRGFSEPNYNFMSPDTCSTGWTLEGLCPNDFFIKLETVAKKEYRLRFSPNIWRSLAQPNTLPYGVMGVAYDGSTDSWVMKNLMSHPSVFVVPGNSESGVAIESCPVVLERKDTVRGSNTWKFGGCYEMPFELTLTRR
jgi:hypothetical protein